LLSKTTKAYVINHGKTMTLDLSGRIGKADTGIYGKSGEYGNLTAGEAYIAPLEGKASRGIVIDGVMAGIGVLTEPLYIKVENGMVTEVVGKYRE